jgi:hypothetical protein
MRWFTIERFDRLPIQQTHALIDSNSIANQQISSSQQTQTSLPTPLKTLAIGVLHDALLLKLKSVWGQSATAFYELLLLERLTKKGREEGRRATTNTNTTNKKDKERFVVGC